MLNAQELNVATPCSSQTLPCPSARQAGMTIVPVGVDAKGNINIAELKQKAEQHK